MAAPVNPLQALWGTARTLSATTTGAVLDLANGAVRLAEVARDRARGQQSGHGVLRIRVLILSDENGTPLTEPQQLGPALDLAVRVFDPAGIRVRVADVRTLGEPAPTQALDPRANQGLLLDDILGHTAIYREHAAPLWDPVGSPITVVVVRSIAGRTTGCSLGTTANWVVCQASLFDPTRAQGYDETVLAHELGHALNLPHHRDPANLMYPVSSPPDDLRGTDLARWQRTVVGSGRHVIPGRSRARD